MAQPWLLTIFGGLLTGVSISLLGVRHALPINGLLAIAAQLLIGSSRGTARGSQR